MKVIAALMIAIGLLMAGLSGLCTAVFSLSALADTLGGRAGSNVGPFIMFALVIGAPFIAGGVGLLLRGLKLWKRQPKLPSDDVF